MRVTIDNLTKRFGDFTAVNNFNMTFEDGKLVSDTKEIEIFSIQFFRCLVDQIIKDTFS